MVVVYPDEVTGAVDGCEGIGEGGVGGVVHAVVFVGGVGFGGDVLPEEVVEEGPERCSE